MRRNVAEGYENLPFVSSAEPASKIVTRGPRSSLSMVTFSGPTSALEGRSVITVPVVVESRDGNLCDVAVALEICDVIGVVVSGGCGLSNVRSVGSDCFGAADNRDDSRFREIEDDVGVTTKRKGLDVLGVQIRVCKGVIGLLSLIVL